MSLCCLLTASTNTLRLCWATPQSAASTIAAVQLYPFTSSSSAVAAHAADFSIRTTFSNMMVGIRNATALAAHATMTLDRSVSILLPAIEKSTHGPLTSATCIGRYGFNSFIVSLTLLTSCSSTGQSKFARCTSASDGVHSSATTVLTPVTRRVPAHQPPPPAQNTAIRSGRRVSLRCASVLTACMFTTAGAPVTWPVAFCRGSVCFDAAADICLCMSSMLRGSLDSRHRSPPICPPRASVISFLNCIAFASVPGDASLDTVLTSVCLCSWGALLFVVSFNKIRPGD